MSQNADQLHYGSLEETLTNSIRRAKEKIYNHSLNTYSLLQDGSQEQQQLSSTTPEWELRPRTASQLNPAVHNRREGAALAAAMKNLQQRISSLERQKQELLSKDSISQALLPDMRKEAQMSKLVSSLKERQQQIKKLHRVNSDLSSKNMELLERISELEEERSRATSHQSHISPQENQGQLIETQQTLFRQQRQRIEELEQKVEQLNQQLATRNQLSHSTIQQLMKQLEQEKQTNLRWIKLHDEQLSVPQKQNEPSAVNQKEKPDPVSTTKKNRSLILKHQQQLQQQFQRSKQRISQLSRQLKQSEQRQAKLKLLVNEIVKQVNNMQPHLNSHLRFLLNRVEKLQHTHVESLRSLSNHSRRQSHSNSRKKSLKMEDLNSSSKKSQQRSAHKSGKKSAHSLTRSQKKQIVVHEQSTEIAVLQREVANLKKQHRNLVVRAEKLNNQDQSLNGKIEETTLLYLSKKSQLQQLKANLPKQSSKREPLLLQ